jgi:hypothetical protein
LQRVAWILAALAGMIWVAGELPSPYVQATNSCETRWRRTRDGWELAENLLPPVASLRPRGFHPLLLTAAEILASLSLLAASAPERPRGAATSPKCPDGR